MNQTTKKTNIKIVIFSVSAILMISMIASAILGKVAEAFPQVPAEVVQMVLTMPALIAILFSLAAGPLSIRIPKKILLLVFLSCMLIGGVLSLTLGPTSIYLLITAAALIGVGQGGGITLSSALITEYFVGEECGAMLGRQSAFVNGGAVIWTFAAGALSTIKWNVSYAVYLALIPILLIVLFLLPMRGPSMQAASGGGEKQKVKLNMRVLYLCVVLFLFTLFFYVFALNVSTFVLSNNLGSTATAGYANTTMSLFGCVIGILYGRIYKVLRNYVFCFAIAITGVGLLALYLIGNLPSVFFAAMCCGTGLTLMMPSSIFSASSSVNAASSATAVAVVGASSNLAMFSSGIILTPIVKAVNGDARTFFVIGAIGLFMVSIVALFDAFKQNKIQSVQGSVGLK